MIQNDPANWKLQDVERVLQQSGLDTGGNVNRLGVGYHSVAVGTSAGDVVRLGRNPGVVGRHQLEMQLLPKLEPQLSVAVPSPHWLASPSALLPFGAIAYPMIPGEVTSGHGAKSLARQTASFLVELHEITDVGDVPLPDVSERRRMLAELRMVVAKAVAPIDRGAALQIDDWFERYNEADELWEFTPRLVHHDASEDNLVLRAGTL
ncbi:MAG: aminoglycoside phosphotransferase family protein, partial [Acidimicrobiia bacterium]|nr:aminoglycoside phosphotransferase family protein [Acidimicrobiia bacterium]